MPGLFSGVVKRPVRGVDQSPRSGAEVKERAELYLFPVWAFMACSKVNFTCASVAQAEGWLVWEWGGGGVILARGLHD
jgi:hypothetical protein